MNFKRLEYTEPAMWRGVVTALIALLGAVGVTVTADLSALVDSLIVAASLALPLVQAVTTRAAVVSPATADKEVGIATGLATGGLKPTGHPQTPGVADHAAPE